MKEIKSPNTIKNTVGIKVFLAGSIEMGSAFDWQSEFMGNFKNTNITFLNPRRNKWNSNWKQSIKNINFRRQVEWELDALEISDYIFMYFDPNTKSPISLLEFGLFARSNKLLVFCPKGFWRKGNVDVVCKKYNIKQFNNFRDSINYIKKESISRVKINI